VPRRKRRSFTQAFKQSVVARMASTDSIRGLAAELSINSRSLYHWRARFETGGLEALRRLGRPSRHDTAEAEPPPAPVDVTDLAQAQRQIGELQRKIGRHQLELDFFRTALQRVRERQPKKGGSGETPSTRGSTR
jgi:transposase